MGNTNGSIANADQSNHVVPNGLFHDLAMIANATDFVMKRSCSSAMHVPPSKRLRRSKRNLKWIDDVEVHTIKHHSCYDEDEHKAMWRSSDEIFLHAKRNGFEKMCEGKDWRKAPEECDMLVDMRYGIRYHPCWTMPLFPYHRGDVLHGSGNKRASHNYQLIQHVQKYGMTAFVDK